MILDNLKEQIEEIYCLANTPGYIYRNIANLFLNVDFQSISELELDAFENSIGNSEPHLFYSTIYIRIKNNFKINEKKYEHIKWHDEYMAYCKMKQINSSTFSFSTGNEIININPVCEAPINA
jgi:hypothetical protein